MFTITTNRFRWPGLAALTAAAFGLAAVIAPGTAQARPVTSAAQGAFPPVSPGSASQASQPEVRPACGDPSRGHAACLALVRTDVHPHLGPLATGTDPSGYGPQDLQDAYDLPSATAGSGRTVAIVDAFDNPNAEADLAVYRDQYGLPPCTTADGCFTKVNQQGEQGDYPEPNVDWAGEISLDVDMVSAACPNCNILLVEADDNSVINLGKAVDTAVGLGAKYVSNSYGAFEQTASLSSDVHYDHPGVVITAASGDGGYGNGPGLGAPNWPAASEYVTAVGGTSLTRAPTTGRGWSETTWVGGGSGCSRYEPKPPWQPSADTGCTANHMTADVSAVADPGTGVAMYATYGYGGWLQAGGTSASSPIIASTYALAGTPAPGSYPGSYPYAHPGALNDVTTGNNYRGLDCAPTFWCAAGPGYDGPTGLGTPHGVAAFFAGKHGTLTGTVTRGRTGGPIVGARVQAGDLSAVTDGTGFYRLSVPVGTYTVTASALTYATKTADHVRVRAGKTRTRNVRLRPVSTVTVHGTVTDGSGHGWPLAAKVSVKGTTASTYTDAATGKYALALPENSTHTLRVEPVYPGYQRASEKVQTGTTDVTKAITVPVDADSCTAPGYQSTDSGCAPSVDGGLVVGTVTDANTGRGVDRAAVTRANPPETVTAPPAGGPSQMAGFYWMFSQATGAQQFKATAHHYVSQAADTNVVADAAARLDFSLKAGQLAVAPGSLSATAQLGSANAKTAKLTVTNTGTAPANLEFAGQPGDFSIAGQLATDGWASLPDLPVTTGTNLAVVDPDTGDVYSLGGTVSTSNGNETRLYVYHPGASGWTIAPNLPDYVRRPVGAFVGGKIYVVGGHADLLGKDPVWIYDPFTLQWSTGAFPPNGGDMWGATAVLNDKIYVVGGLENEILYGKGGKAVKVYDPATDTWSAAADYPQSIAFESCGTLDGKIYCAGGYQSVIGGEPVDDAYVYDPVTDAWSAIDPLPIPLALGQYAAANGQFLVVGGLTVSNGLASVTDKGYSYTPGKGWAPLPDLPYPTWKGGSACGPGGFYVVGGGVGSEPWTHAEVLPGYGNCGSTDVSWLSTSPSTATLDPGQSLTVTVTMDADDPAITQPGDYTADLTLESDTPYKLSVPVTMTVEPPKGWGAVAGTVTDAGTGKPIAGAAVRLCGYDATTGGCVEGAQTHTLTTDRKGEYGLWLDYHESPLLAVVTADGYTPRATTTRVVPGRTTTRDFALTKT